MKKRIFQLISFYSESDFNKFINSNINAPCHHLWSYDYLKNQGYDIKVVDYNKKSLINRIGELFTIRNLAQQINCFRDRKKCDLIYAPFFADIVLLCLLKSIGLFKKQIIVVPHGAYNIKHSNLLKKMKQSIEKYALVKGVTKALFLNENIYKLTANSLQNNNFSFIFWGTDIRPANVYIQQNNIAPSEDFIFSTGKSGRDFNLLIKSFSTINFKLHIATTKNYAFDKSLDYNNVQLDFSLEDNIEVVKHLLPLYYNALAVAIPIEQELNMPTGSTTLFEALSMGKPVIISEGNLHPIDVEKEGVGIKIAYGDTDGWCSAIKYLIDNPDEARKMGEKGRSLCLKKYNYISFSKQVQEEIESI